MGKVFKPIYVCDQCETQFEDPLQLRSFLGPVSDGETDNFFVIMNEEDSEPKMYCVNCIPKVLDLTNENLEITTVRINTISPQEIVEKDEIIQQEIVEDETKHNVDITDEEEDLEQEIIEELEKPYPAEEYESETIVDNVYIPVSGDLLETGKYLVLYKISNEEQEEYFAKKHKRKNADEFRKMYGSPLIGLYFSTNGYVNDLPKKTIIKSIKIVNKIIFDIPNVINKDCYLDTGDDSHAYIEKQYFDMQIEPIIIEPETIEEETIPMEQLFEPDMIKETYNPNIEEKDTKKEPKKRFKLEDNIQFDDDYI